MANLLPLLLALTGPPAPAAPSPVPGFEGLRCVPGYCPVQEPGRMPGGVMFLALGLVGVGVHGLRRGRRGAEAR